MRCLEAFRYYRGIGTSDKQTKSIEGILTRFLGSSILGRAFEKDQIYLSVWEQSGKACVCDGYANFFCLHIKSMAAAAV